MAIRHRTVRTRSSNRRDGSRNFFVALFVSSVAAFLIFTSLPLSLHPNRPLPGAGDDVSGSGQRRLMLAMKSDPLKPKLDQIRKQADDHRAVVLSYASYARKLKLESSKLVRLFADITRNFTDLVNKPVYRALADSAALESIDEATLRQFEKEVKERIKLTRQVIGESKESFDNQLKIQKLKDTIFAVNEQLTKAKKQGAFSSLIAAKSIPKSLHCLSMKLMEERIAQPDRYTDDGKHPAPDLEDPRLYHYAIFSDNVLAASVVVNSAVKNAREPSKHVFHVVTDKMNLGAMQNENRQLWKLGTLPPGLITFYSTTKPLDKSWHVLGLGYNPSISMEEIHNAAVVHFNGNMKPWLDIAMPQFKPLWSKYVDYDLEFVQACNFGS